MNANDIALTQVDQLGFILSQIAELEAKAEAIKAALKDAATAGAGNVPDSLTDPSFWCFAKHDGLLINGLRS